MTPGMPAEMTAVQSLTLAIPVHNDTAALNRLLRQAARLKVGDRIVVVDDASDKPVTTAALLDGTNITPDRLTLLHHKTNKGPGAARNLALQHTNTSHVLYCDSDDLLTPEMPHLLRDLAGRNFDFCLFKHHDSRMADIGKWGQPQLDEAHWRSAGVGVGALNSLNPAQAATLAETANYPWNKIYRTDFLKSHSIGCTEIMVHEDMELHWRGFLNAKTILVSDRISVQHFVSDTAQRLTNRAGQERLLVFGPLGLIADEIAARKDDRFALSFLRFASGLLDWIRDNLTPGLHADLAQSSYRFFCDHISTDSFSRLAKDDPALALRINLQMERGRT